MQFKESSGVKILSKVIYEFKEQGIYFCITLPNFHLRITFEKTKLTAKKKNGS